MGSGGNGILVPMDNEARADGFCEFVPKLDHLGELVTGVDVKKRKWQRTGIERLARQMDEHARVFPDGIQHHGVPKLGGSFAENVNGFAFKLAKMRPFVVHTATFW